MNSKEVSQRFLATINTRKSCLPTAINACKLLFLHHLQIIGRNISANSCIRPIRSGKSVARLDVTCLKPRNKVGRKTKAFASTLAVARILALP